MIKNILVTGGAGFIGSHLIEKLLTEYPEAKIFTIDNFDPFYSRDIKERNLKSFIDNNRFQLLEGSFVDKDWLNSQFENQDLDLIIHLAAKAGVRPSIDDPIGYTQTNIMGLVNLLNLAKEKQVSKFVYASSSSVYGTNPNVPWDVSDFDLQPISPYAASKISGEQYCKVYNQLHKIPIVALRFFTVYGPRQRPDLAIHKFFRKIDQGETIDQFGDGSTRRDYTYIDDIISGVIGAAKFDDLGYSVYNLGNSGTITLKQLITEIENAVGKKAVINLMPEQPGDVRQTFASISKSTEDLGFIPSTNISDGLKKFKEWYNEIYD